MRSLRRRRPLRPPRDPAPSKWGYRLQRLMLTPAFVRLIRVGTPLALLGVIVSVFWSDPENRALVESRVAEAKIAVQQRPEFMVTALDVTGAGAALAAEVIEVLRDVLGFLHVR